ncbi:MAG: prephenate dehydrogenase/arogenate dehydrogenase family protein [Bdellovibrionaceae bacterium]|nr:prephenate dehydrogenase/arogenate dehydrogenase family protein [Pseudobdellovibrionaceae bacterium]
MSSARKTAVFENPSLEDLRAQIDQVDRELVALLERRANLVFAVGEIKRQKNLPIHDPEREAKIKIKVQNLTSPDGPLSAGEMSSVFMTLVERFRKMEEAHVQINRGIELFPNCSLDFTKPQRVVIWGFGLLGSSFYLALNEILPHWNFLVIDPALDQAAFMNWRKERKLANIALSDEVSVKTAALVVLAAPVDVNDRHLASSEFQKGALVIDLGSTKRSIQDQFQKKSGTDFTFIGGHPLAGKEVAGFQNGDALLFYNKVFCWVAPPTRQVTPPERATADALALCLGSKPFWMSADEHDHALAWTSHLPQLLSTTLANVVMNKKFSHEVDYFPGYITELLRTSGSPLSRWEPIFKTNAVEVKRTLDELITGLSSVQQKLDDPSRLAIQYSNSNRFYNRFQAAKKKG